MKLGAQPKKVAILILLLLVAAYFLYSNLASSPASSAGPSPHTAASNAASSPETVVPARSVVARGGTSRRSEQEFHPSFHMKGVDPSTIDPKLRLDLLDKVRSVDLGPATRNLFAYGAMPPPALTQQAKNIGPIHPGDPVPGAPGGAPGSPGAGGPPQPPPPPPITLKYYGYTAQRSDGRKRAFFSEGDCSPNAAPTAQCDIFVAAEGDLILKRYKVVRIGTSSAEVEDTQFNHSQPLPIAQESPG